ncbi:hypothetical protein NF699_09715 [Sphingomonadaceae bacterium OTU29LAMAA1]|nr:hypothetical protein NF699_09715 [Sphingomonadaceae bacterium OTU29LAMAA1]
MSLGRIIKAVEPWYNWGMITVERMDELQRDDNGRLSTGGEGEVGFFDLQWFGIHIGVHIGRTPKRARGKGAA